MMKQVKNLMAKFASWDSHGRREGTPGGCPLTTTRSSHKYINAIQFFFSFPRLGFSVALEPVLELALVEQAGPKLTNICLPLPTECWNERRVPPPPG